MLQICFSHPWFLLLTLLPCALLVLRWAGHRKRNHPVPFSGFDLLPGPRRTFSGFSRLADMLWLLAMLLLVPVMAGIESAARSSDKLVDSALVIVLDTSSSMTADDFVPGGRLEEARKRLQQFVSSAPASEIGLIVFAATPRLMVPVTNDHAAVRSALMKITAAEYGQDGTAIGTALASAVNRLRGGTWRSRQILLITDGVNNSGAVSPSDAARLARTFGIRISAVGLGTDSPSNYWVASAEGTPVRVEARVEIDEKTLEDASHLTGGSYRRVKSSDELLAGLWSAAPPGHGAGPAPSESRFPPRTILVLASLLLICSGFVLSEFIIPELPG